jgi:riboflavin biosynthesis pyrimidine reductase
MMIRYPTSLRRRRRVVVDDRIESNHHSRVVSRHTYYVMRVASSSSIDTAIWVRRHTRVTPRVIVVLRRRRVTSCYVVAP